MIPKLFAQEQQDQAVLYLIKSKGYTIRFIVGIGQWQALYGEEWFDVDPIAEANHFIQIEEAKYSIQQQA